MGFTVFPFFICIFPNLRFLHQYNSINFLFFESKRVDFVRCLELWPFLTNSLLFAHYMKYLLVTKLLLTYFHHPNKTSDCSLILTELISMLYLTLTCKAPHCDSPHNDVTSYAPIIPSVMSWLVFFSFQPFTVCFLEGF